MMRNPHLRCWFAGGLFSLLALAALLPFAADWLPDTLPFDSAPHSVWRYLTVRLGLGREIWASLVPGALMTGLVAAFAMRLELLRDPEAGGDEARPQRLFAIRSWASGIVAALLFGASWPLVSLTTRIGGNGLDFLAVLLILTALSRFRHTYAMRYSWLGVPVLLLSAAVLGFERPAPLALLPALGAVLFATALGMWPAWAVAGLSATATSGEPSWHRPFSYLAVVITALGLGLDVWYTARQLDRADGSAADTLAVCTIEDARDARWLVSDAYLAPSLDRHLRLAGSASPVLVQIGRNFDSAYLASLLHASEVLGYRSEDMLSLKVAAELSVSAFAEELSLVESASNALARTWSPQLWPWRRLTNVWAKVAARVPHEQNLRGAYVRRMFARAALEEGAAMQSAGHPEEAASAYFWVLHEVDPGNVSAILSLVGMLNRGYRFGPFDKEEIETGARDVFASRAQVQDLALRIRMCGSVYLTEAERRAAFDKYRPQLAQYARIREDEQLRFNEQLEKRLRESMHTGTKEEVAAEAKGVLRQDRRNLLGNGVMGTLAATDGDYAVAEYYLKRAAEAKGAPVAALNNYAEVLRRLGKFAPAEVNARRAVAAAPDFWRTHETLADVLLSRNAPARDVEQELVTAERLAGVAGWTKPLDVEHATLALIRVAVWQMTGHELEAAALEERLRSLPLGPEQQRRLTK